MIQVWDAIVMLLATALQVLHGVAGSYVLAIILLTIGIRFVLHPLTRKQLKSMKAMQTLQPQMEVLRRKYKDNPQQLNAEVMNLYRTSGVNPFQGCLPLLLQLPVLYALFAVLRRPNVFGGETLFGVALEKAPWPLEVFVQHPLLLIIPLLSGFTTYYQQKMSITDPQQAKMLIFMPLMVGWFATQFAIGLSIYWIASTTLAIVEYFVVVGPPKRVGTAPPKEQRKQPKPSQAAKPQENR